VAIFALGVPLSTAILATPSFAAMSGGLVTTLTACGVHNVTRVNQPGIEVFSTRVTARQDGGLLLYDQTIAAPPGDPAVQAAFDAARAALRSAGAASINGPTLLSSSSNTTTSLVSTKTTSTDTITETVGPATVMTGGGQAGDDAFLTATGGPTSVPCTNPFPVPAGTLNINLVRGFETVETYQATVTRQATYELVGSGRPQPCSRSVTGDVVGPFTVNAGEHLCFDNARVVGPVQVNAGGALTVNASAVTRGIVADRSSFITICGSQISGPSSSPGQGVVVTNATAPLRIGDPANSCAANRVAGDVVLTGNTAGLTLGADIVSGNVTVNNNTGSTDVIMANTIFKVLACSGNNPAPTNAGQPNTASSKSGQCASL